MIVVYQPILSLIFTEISLYETPYYGASGMGMHCLHMSHKVIIQANCFIPITHAQWEWKIGNNRLNTCTTKQSSLLKQMHNIWVGGWVCQVRVPESFRTHLLVHLRFSLFYKGMSVWFNKLETQAKKKHSFIYIQLEIVHFWLDPIS